MDQYAMIYKVNFIYKHFKEYIYSTEEKHGFCFSHRLKKSRYSTKGRTCAFQALKSLINRLIVIIISFLDFSLVSLASLSKLTNHNDTIMYAHISQWIKNTALRLYVLDIWTIFFFYVLVCISSYIEWKWVWNKSY